ncbi:hypothetical protein JAAARDRAFT_53605 [Jaapia argillacea MUCL 33604]|uniref:Exocyst complex component Sec3 PIP2-binding N-terminal domain-containing protein n=1 Tax=Jaapia argillacea MUCL 33604 TaxID=933084 RepID=A0A067QIN9_9AGAM|nr:hypothetical protein JAAARDRAFT_53605 [Jaapia argillacea MUCL 33604]
MSDIRQRIISSVFAKRNAVGNGVEETYVAHLRIMEDVEDGGGGKARYILLSQTNNGSGYLHKSKLNTNGSFSVGKTWRLVELRAIEVVNPNAFNITLARSYRWHAENAADQAQFLTALVRTFRTITGGAAPLDVIGVQEYDGTPGQSDYPSQRTATPSSGPASSSASTTSRRAPVQQQRSQTPSSSHDAGDSSSRVSTPAPSISTRSQSRPRRGPSPAVTSSRPPTPDSTSTPMPAVPVPLPSSSVPTSSPFGQTASPSFSSSSTNSTIRPRQARRPSNAASTSGSITASRMSTASQAPSLNIPSSPTPSRAKPNGPSILSNSYHAESQSILSSSRGSLDVPTAPLSSSFTPNSSFSMYAPDTPRVRPVSPTASANSSSFNGGPSKSQSQTSLQKGRLPSRGPSPLPPEIMSRGISQANSQGLSQQSRRDQNARISFFDPVNQATLDRLLSGDMILPASPTGERDREGGEGEGGEGGGADAEIGEESAQATMTSVEEMLEGYEWASEDIIGGRSRATNAADQIEARLLDELTALERANVHSFLESDDRVALVIKYLDEAILELDGMDSLVSSYKIHLNAVSDDISYIQSQNRGLQVQNQNQRALLTELENLLQTVHVDQEALITLTQESLEKPNGIQRLEESATELYKALQAGRDTDMAATMERLNEYRTHNAQFCKRLLDYLTIMFTAQSRMLLGDTDGLSKSKTRGRGRPTIVNHRDLETYLGRYSGLILYLKELDESTYAKLCATYFSAASDLHNQQMRALLVMYAGMIKKGPEEDVEQNFGGSAASRPGIRRTGTIVRPQDGRKDKDKSGDTELSVSDAFGQALEQIAPQIYREEDFIADFLQINDAGLTFADYMGLENYFRRQAARHAGISQSTMKLVRGALDLIFGFLPAEIKAWIDNALARDHLQIIGVIASLERFQADADERGNNFLLTMLEKQHTRLKALFDRHVSDQIKVIEDTKITSKKRNGVAPFIKYFPSYIGRVESQLVGADTLDIRGHVDLAYEKIVQVMFDSLKQMAKLDGEGEDKGQLNYHVIMIENMHHFVAEMGQTEIGSVAAFVKRAESIYDENLGAYVRMVLKRPFAKIIDYFEGVERLLKTTAPTEVSNNGSYNKSSLKKVTKEYNGKDIRKYVDALFGRVEKHFTEASEKATTEKTSGITPGTVMVGVWKACEEELLRITDLFSKRISQCYAESGVSLEYTPADVEAAFRRHRVGS